MPQVSVIIPAYNAAKHFRETMESIFNQTYRNFEVIVVDDGSTDETVDILKGYGDRVRWTVQRHQGQAYALNRAIGMSKGKYLAYFDADDIMSPTKLEVQATYLDEHPEIDVVYTDMRVTQPNGDGYVKKYRAVDPFFLLQYCCVSRITVMHRRSCLDAIGLFDGSVTGSDDWDMWVRMSERCSMKHIGEALSEYRLHGENISFRRANQLSHVRRMRREIVRRACRRRGNPFWLRAMFLSAWSYWLLGKIPYFGKRFPHLWGAGDRIQRSAERLLLGWLATPPQPLENLQGLRTSLPKKN
ncbi:MAG: glycosyltransferase [Pirellulales bacterium]|nr:glycosyltransferase [Pirellulales bacterium]